MISRLPRWVWAGGAVLSFVAGMVNVVGLLGFKHQGLSHLTGATTLLGASLVARVDGSSLQLVLLMLSFLGGAAVSGFVLPDNALQLGRRYGFLLLVESLLLSLSVLFLQRGQAAGEYFASCACGLQNGMAGNYSGASVRTTHVSGMFTDLGVIFGQGVRGVKPDLRRVRLYLALVSGFLLGGVAGAFLFQKVGYFTLFFPAALTGLAGAGYGAFASYQRFRAAH